MLIMLHELEWYRKHLGGLALIIMEDVKISNVCVCACVCTICVCMCVHVCAYVCVCACKLKAPRDMQYTTV